MKTYENKFGFLAVTIDGVDYISNKGDKLELPENNEYVKVLLIKKYIQESAENVKPLKTQK